MRGLISPTVIKSMVKNPSWHDEYVKLFGGENGFDSDGFDQFGYNEKGVDRAGYTAHQYCEKKAFDEEDFEYDEGCHNFQVVWNRCHIMHVAENLYVPIQKNQYHNDEDDLLNACIWDTPDGYWEIEIFSVK